VIGRGGKRKHSWGREPRPGIPTPHYFGADEFMEVDLAIPPSRILHLSVMPCDLNDTSLRSPAEPSPPPIKEAPDSPENPEAPVREPDPTEPTEI
jgi:hypothetical protein